VKPATKTHIDAVDKYLRGLQSSIISSLEKLDGTRVKRDDWTRAEGGGGHTCVLEGGPVIERAGVNFSRVSGPALPAAALQAHPHLAGRAFEALGVSVIVHPRNPYAPTAHVNVRYFTLRGDEQEPVWWFGGVADLTPIYGFQEDCRHFHKTLKDALAPFGPERYPVFKKACDDYYHLPHRGQARGVGGVWFDEFNEPGFAQSFAMAQAVGDAFVPAYIPLVEKRQQMKFGERETRVQAIRRARYVEFNLVYDRGTAFGLQSGGRVESIFVSMPPSAAWVYDWQPEPGSVEAQFEQEFLQPKDWA
jgi:coproporphyrinogen III oxidase